MQQLSSVSTLCRYASAVLRTFRAQKSVRSMPLPRFNHGRDSASAFFIVLAIVCGTLPLMANTANTSSQWDSYLVSLTEANIRAWFSLGPAQRLTTNRMETFLSTVIGINADDAAFVARECYLNWNQPCFTIDSSTRTKLINSGITPISLTLGLTPSDFLAYLRITFGEGPCQGQQAGSQNCPAKMKDFQLALIVMQNVLWNIRYTESAVSYLAGDDNVAGAKYQYENRMSIHRESLANRKTFDAIGQLLGFSGNPVAQRVLDTNNSEDCHFLEQAFGNRTNFIQYFSSPAVGVHQLVAEVTANQLYGKSEFIPQLNKTIIFGAESYLKGTLESWSDIGKVYLADPNIYNAVSGVFNSGSNWTCGQIKTLINAAFSFPSAAPASTAEILNPPYHSVSPQLTGDEVIDFVIAIGNALTNSPNAIFADVLPPSDLADLNELTSPGYPNGVENPEQQFTGYTINAFYHYFLGPRKRYLPFIARN